MTRNQALHGKAGAVVVLGEIGFGDPAQIAKILFQHLRKAGAPFELIVKPRRCGQHRDTADPRAEKTAHQQAGSAPGNPVVDADISGASARGQIGKHRHHGYARLAHILNQALDPRVIERHEHERVVVDRVFGKDRGVTLAGEIATIKRRDDAVFAEEAGGQRDIAFDLVEKTRIDLRENESNPKRCGLHGTAAARPFVPLASPVRNGRAWPSRGARPDLRAARDRPWATLTPARRAIIIRVAGMGLLRCRA